MKSFNIGFLNRRGEIDETQIDFKEFNCVELLNLILSFKDEMEIKEVLYVEEA